MDGSVAVLVVWWSDKLAFDSYLQSYVMDTDNQRFLLRYTQSSGRMMPFDLNNFIIRRDDMRG